MIGLFKVKEKQREESQNNNRRGASSAKKQSAGELRLNKGSLSLRLFEFFFWSYSVSDVEQTVKTL